MPLKDMKLKEKEVNDIVSPEKEKENIPKYPWELKIHLDEELISKLELTELPAVGEKMTLVANIDVTNSGEDESVENGVRRSMVLQITEMSIEKLVSDDTLNKLYK